MKIDVGANLHNPEGLSWFPKDKAVSGERVKFLDEGQLVDSKINVGQKQLVIVVEYQEIKYQCGINYTSQKELVQAFGSDTVDWIGKEAEIVIEVERSTKQKRMYLEPVITAEDF